MGYKICTSKTGECKGQFRMKKGPFFLSSRSSSMAVEIGRASLARCQHGRTTERDGYLGDATAIC